MSKTAGNPPTYFLIQTPKGGKEWLYHYHPELGAILRDGPRDKDTEELKPAPPWVKESAEYWADALTRIDSSLARRQDAMRVMKAEQGLLEKLSFKCLNADLPDARRLVAGLAAELKSLSVKAGVPTDLRDHVEELGMRLALQLDRTTPPKTTRDDEPGPTKETAARLELDRVKAFLDRLTGHRRAAAEEIREILRGLRGPLDARAANLERLGGGGSGRSQRFLHPVERLSDELTNAWLERYRPWSSEMSVLPALRHKAAGVSYLELVTEVLWEGADTGMLDMTHGMPLGRTRQVVSDALNRYPRIP